MNKHDKETKKEYRTPVLNTVQIKLGVFGSYGEDDHCGRQHRGHHGSNGGWDGFGGWSGAGD